MQTVAGLTRGLDLAVPSATTRPRPRRTRGTATARPDPADVERPPPDRPAPCKNRSRASSPSSSLIPSASASPRRRPTCSGQGPGRAVDLVDQLDQVRDRSAADDRPPVVAVSQSPEDLPIAPIHPAIPDGRRRAGQGPGRSGRRPSGPEPAVSQEPAPVPPPPSPRSPTSRPSARPRPPARSPDRAVGPASRPARPHDRKTPRTASASSFQCPDQHQDVFRVGAAVQQALDLARHDEPDPFPLRRTQKRQAARVLDRRAGVGVVPKQLALGVPQGRGPPEVGGDAPIPRTPARSTPARSGATAEKASARLGSGS